MPICPACRTGYDRTESRCPKCFAAKPPELGSDYPSLSGPRPENAAHSNGLRCSTFSLVCLYFAQVAALLGVVVSIIGGCLALRRGRISEAMLIFFIYTPISIGGFVAFGLSIKYARYE